MHIRNFVKTYNKNKFIFNVLYVNQPYTFRRYSLTTFSYNSIIKNLYYAHGFENEEYKYLTLLFGYEQKDISSSLLQLFYSLGFTIKIFHSQAQLTYFTTQEIET